MKTRLSLILISFIQCAHVAGAQTYQSETERQQLPPPKPSDGAQKNQAKEGTPGSGEFDPTSADVSGLRNRISELRSRLKDIGGVGEKLEKATQAKVEQSERLKEAVLAAASMAGNCTKLRAEREQEKNRDGATLESKEAMVVAVKDCERDMLDHVTPAVREMKTLEAALIKDFVDAVAMARVNTTRAAGTIKTIEVLEAILKLREATSKLSEITKR